jgi:uncharacterized DUF497 family protein
MGMAGTAEGLCPGQPGRRVDANLALTRQFGIVIIPYRETCRMEFEFDPTKSASNLVKHGIDFGAVQAIWQDVMRVDIPARTTDEPRWLVIGQIDGKHWSVVVTYREQRVRIISARRSRKEEVALYEG